MAQNPNKISKSKQSATKTIWAAFNLIKNSDEPLSGKQIMDHIRKTVEFTDWEKEIYEKTGYVRWEAIFHFYSIDCTKAGYLIKRNGIWSLTEEGEKAMKLGPEKMMENATIAYRKWADDNKKSDKKTKPDEDNEIEENQAQAQRATIEALVEQAIAGIKDFVMGKNPYEFQDLVGALLRAMGYHTPFIAPKGKDGGMDIIAYSDPLGATTPRIKVQVKHWKNDKVSVDEIRSLAGLLNKDSDIGLFVATDGFTSDAQRCARENHKHIKLLDINEFISLWQQYYHKMTDEDKNLLPLHSIYFLGSND
ncbi:restriction endonuclease [Alistipes sp.]|uniref:restriction endonuclease n=1 Tax=Alistipes sp. TaxID=1872444 RepID=UPI003AB7376A